MQRLRDLPSNRIGLFYKSVGSLILALVCTCCLLAGIPKHVPTQSKNNPAGTALAYEVVSIKPASPNSDPDSGGTEELTDGYKATNVSLLTLIRRAYGVDINNQISGGPTWLNSDTYDIRATMDESVADRLKCLNRLNENSRGRRCFRLCWRTASS